jgi:hypothetical protein
LIGFAAAASFGAAALYAHGRAAPACDSEPALDRIYALLHSQLHLDSIFVNDVKALSGGYFSDNRDCSAEVTAIRGNVNASDMPWRSIRFHIVRQDGSQPPAITLNVGDQVPLAEPPPSFWSRLRAYL